MTPQEIWFTNARLTIHVPQASSAVGISLIEHHMAEGFAVPLHVHADEDESFFVLDGECRFQVGDEVITRTAGQSLHAAAGQPHSFRVVSPEVRFLTVSTGRFEEMVLSLARPAVSGTLPPQAPPTESQINALIEACLAHGIEFRGPPVE